MKILLVQLFSNGDCLYATSVARQIKKDFPGHATSWYNNKSREIRKHRTIDFFNDKFNVDIESDNVAYACGLAYYAVNNLTES